jgi:protein-disulfide isomerase
VQWLCDNQAIVLRLSRFSLAAALLALTAFGCHAQQPPAGASTLGPVPPALARRIEVTLRMKASLPPGSTVNIGPRTPGPIPGYDQIAVTVSSEDGVPSRPINFLLSTDGKTLAQFPRYDLTADPRTLVSGEGRPFRGGPPSAPVLIVGFDDLECPYCARLHASIFPALTERYKDQVRIVYRDFPLDQHPWAMRAAVDTNCLAAQSNAGYWNVVDYVHAHEGEIGASLDPAAKDSGPETKTLVRATEQLDKLTRDQAVFQKVDLTKFDACIKAQDTKAIEASKTLGNGLGVDSTPSLFINGDKIDGAVPLAFLFKIIDQALIAEGKTPPPPYVEPKPVAPPVPPASPATPPAPTKK